MQAIVRQVQCEAFSDDVECIKSDGTVSKRSNLINLYTFIDEDGLLKVDGRLAMADFTEEVKYPVTLPAKYQLCILILRNCHQEINDCSLNAPLVHKRLNFRITHARQLVC